ncbi:MAG: hypothetical protein Kow0059_10190 [Candidatus Sumerlaeia bacterium]
MKRAFTLIELLIVVAIIAILAAIAVPNFLEAQVRSKVSRTKSDLRTFATALESYAVDHNHYPPYGTEPIIFAPATEPQVLEPHWLTTPIAYVSSASIFFDPFRTKPPVGVPIEHYKPYDYVNWDDVRYRNTSFVHELYGEWRLTGAGPDTWRFNTLINGPDQGGGFAVRSYDPTNGTVSVGDIFRTQKHGEPSFP